MLIFLITDENFDQVKSRKEKTKMGIITKLHKSKNSIQISVNTMAPFAIYKWEQAGHFAISNKLDEITKYIELLGYEMTFTPIDSKYANVKSYVDKARDCNVEKITQWSSVVVDCKGILKITPPPSEQLYSITLTTKHGVRLLLKWLKKYLVLATKEIENNRFIPTLTGGLDTRTLTWFWRDLYQGTDYYLKAVKPDGRNNIARGTAEMESATQVLQCLGKSLERKEEFNSRLTFSGVFTDCGLGWQDGLNDVFFVYDFIVFHFAYGSEKYFGNGVICPFVDNLYLQLRHPEKHYMRTLLALLLCPDLLDIPLYSYAGKPPYLLNEEFAYLIPKVEKFIREYNLRKRVAKIKTRVLSFRWLYKIESRVFSLFRKLLQH